MFIDIDCARQKKYNQHAYGDYFTSRRYPDTGRLIAVLSDGLGSGIKANILACLTATMLLRFIAGGSNIQKACETILNALPVCKVRKISYATFSAIDCRDDGAAQIVEEGNPQFIWLRDQQVLTPEHAVITSRTFANRRMHIYQLQLARDDRLIFCSDGVTQTGMGSPQLKLGLRRAGLIEMVLAKLRGSPQISSRELAGYIVAQAQKLDAGQKAQDDISAVSLHFREPRKALVFTGPPYDHSTDNFYARIFQNFNGKKAVCGGTTANLLSRELNLQIISALGQDAGRLPGISYMDGAQLVTEGILTLTKTAEYLENNELVQEDAAAKLARFLLDSDCINFMVGARLNQAHYDPALPVEIEIRRTVIKKISRLLTEKYFKKATIQYI